MVPQYFFAHDDTASGPWSAAQMRALAAAGRIAPADAVWQEGTTLRVPASRVKSLFPIIPEPPAAAAAPEPIAAAEVVAAPAVEAPAPAVNRFATEGKPRLKRVVGIKGGILMGQDGVDVKFKKKCPKCGYEDPCRSTAAIRVGVARIPYYCRTCRRGRAVEITGTG